MRRITFQILGMHLTRPLTKTLQRLGYALMLPVSLLPLAALLIRLGDLQLPALSLTGQALFSQMPLIYAIAIAFGLSERGHGGQALTGAVGYLLLSSAMDSLLPHLHADMMCGLLAGLTVALCWPWAMTVRLPRALHPLQGEPLAMLLSALACLLLVLPLAGLWPAFEQGVVLLAQRLLDTPLGAFCYGVLNRLLIPFGLHQVLGSLVGIGTGDLDALAQALPPHSEFVAGLYPIIMFGLPGATLALCKMIGIEVGSYFSAGLLDLLLCAPSGVNAFWLIPIGILFFVIYALTFWLLLDGEKLSRLTPLGHATAACAPSGDPQMLAIQYLKALGGLDNLQAISVCLTRLSLRVESMGRVDQSRLPQLGCLSWMIINDHQLVLVLGPNAGPVESQIRMLAERQSVPLGNHPVHPAQE
ncbi:PTS N-acetylglucosamine transporter subunit IIBC [Aeromonas schubertii]|uniref:PTS N-acetylglucosamine transporter subunit IIBC n=2 Tax=Aeromonas schubertii TaxID=652 RepID=A0A0S2SHZ9_9GAMM|nr:PTS N-acetylglucosamine transporter subunit IIBC [Aeromonas schubertii]